MKIFRQGKHFVSEKIYGDGSSNSPCLYLQPRRYRALAFTYTSSEKQ